ncbi:cellulose biosynthesis cyclic di-GMP-binding regulatory protein BcsB [Companilactobacillus halodurans]|uniref:Cellulose biosynthesis cyclic di-GMP-binding regulatory protein BcsB n=1 Tax=Companilactobacillus halodurans TaxID=2584183 RepID=A0A5P0ZN98_9LACO|nr:cellulose biosynthesis cyclic di-GMP-binding regulatory protein BcsB [Companilactobacillus halodurans]MQS75579.1 cellulose biosynthesis cyclic di-GMP-binding regulatory protein BcsB [Companilactobacillus halodurans]MQS96293.1 cellulose biosynthesis cyclic di-GMP-binding regulatory protein BcsB [Companilactobacillus halodurans]
MLFAVYCATSETTVKAEDDQTYTQQFQNNIMTISGKSVETDMYFNKMDYWQVDKATFNFNYQVSQLANSQASDITVSLNGVKFYSFRPQDSTGFQTESVDVPLDLMNGSNKLTISGQILNQDNQVQTPANWLTVGKGSNVNFEYQLEDADETLSSFYNHFSGQDTIAHQNSQILTANKASAAELTASMVALSGEARIITENSQIPVIKFDQAKTQMGDYSLVISKYQHLPKQLKKVISKKDVDDQAIIKTYYVNGKHYLIATSQNDKLLEKAGRFIANEELMKQTNKDTEVITNETDTLTSTLHDNGVRHLTTTPERMEGAGHKETSYLVQLPNDRINANGSKIQLHFNYSKNLDFSRSLVTVYVNQTVIGSSKLLSKKANNDSITVDVPKNLVLGSSFTVRVAFDLDLKGNSEADSGNTPWAQVNPQSKMLIKSQRNNDLLFSNYPSLFIKDETYDHLAVVVPKKLSGNDFKALTNIFNLIGNFAKSNTGEIKFYNEIPNQNVLKNSNVIVIGTPQNNQMIKELNSHLYFKYTDDFKRIAANEKMSLEQDYGRNIGTAQLLRSPYNDKRGMLVVTGATTNDVYLASTQINFQNNVQKYNGDAIVVDMNNGHFGYRFKKNKAIDKNLMTKRQITKNSQLIIYLGIAVLIIILIGFGVILTLHKQGFLNGGNRNGKS